MVAFVMRRVLLFNESGCLWGMLRSISLNPRPAGFALLGGGGVHSIPKTAVKAAKVKEVDSRSALVWTTSRASQTERPFLSVFCSCRSFAGPWVCCFPWLSVCVCVCVLSHFSRVVWLCATPWTVAHLRPWDSPGENTGVSCHALQGIFSTQGSNPCILRLTCIGRRVLYY